MTNDMASLDMSKRRFIQPLAVALVSLVFTLLFFSMARVDLRQLEGVIHDMLKQKAFFVVDGIEAASQIRYDRILKSGAAIDGFQPGLPADDETVAIQESLVKALIDLARDVDLRAQKLPLIPDELKALAASEHLHAIVILDKNGDVAFQSSPVSFQVTSQAKELVTGRREAAVHLFGGISEPDTMAVDFVGIRGRNGNGAVLLVMDKNSIQYWAMKISTRAAIENSPMGRGIVYLAAEDAQERVLTQTGSVPSEKVSECLLLAGGAREADNPVSACVKFGDIKFLEVFLPFKMDGQVVGKIRVGLETRETDALLQEKRRHIFLWAGLMMAIGILVMGLLYQTQNRHISRLQAVQENLYHAERLSSLAKLGARVAHEVRNPLNAISMAVQRLQREFAPAESGKNQEEFGYITRIVRDEIRRINTIVEDFLSLSRSDRLDLRQASIAAVLERVHFLVREEVQARGVRVETQGLENAQLMVDMDVHKMEQALLNIVRNAADAISGEGAITLVLESTKKNFIRIRVRDTGSGIAANETGRIFDPDYTTKSNGTGLGLSIAHEIVLAHGGEIRVQSIQGRETVFDILLPCMVRDTKEKRIRA
jgi:signal transduction histidine kinase